MNNKQKEHCGLRPVSIHKVVRIGAYHDEYYKKNLDVFCEITYKDSKLSIHGVVAPKRNGDCDGSCGQMYDSITENLDTMVYAEGWNKVKAFAFVETWKDWHLNDMRAYCEHQKAEGFEKMLKQEVTIYKWKMTSEAISEKSKVEDASMEKLKKGEIVKLTKKEQKILALSYSIEGITMELPDTIAKYYIPNGTETKTRNWLNFDEFPTVGLLGKPCATCGYKYGHEWKHEDIPDDVLKSLESLPETDKQPAWI